MKKIYKTLFIITLMIATFSCKDDLLDKAPLDKFSETTIWESLSFTEAYVNNQYNVLPKLGFFDWIRAYQLSCFTDEAAHKYGYSNVTDYWNGSMTSSLTTGIDVWQHNYDYIEGCNVFLKNIENVPATTQAEQELKDRLTGEIYALRAWSYMDLAARYGGVVLVTEPFALEDDFTRTRSTFEATTELVIDDLDNAISLLPVSYPDNLWGHITKGAAMAMKSRMLLYAASPLFNPSGDVSKWQAAATAAKAVIDLDTYKLETDYKQVFMTIKNDEIIMCRLVDVVNDATYNYFLIVEGLGGGIDGKGYCNGWSTSMVNQNLVDAFEWNDGTLFDWNNPVDAADPYGIGENGQVDTQGNPLKKRDPRFYASVTFDGSSWINESTAQFWICEESNNYTKNPFAPDFKVASDVYGNNSIGNFLRKMDVPEVGYIYRKSMPDFYDWMAELYPYNVPWIIFRYSEILLNYAEASFEAGDEATALTYLNKVRERVSMPPVVASGNELREKIQHERRIELCFETHRYFDARRWKIAAVEFNKPLKGVRIVKDKNSNTKVYNVFDFQQRNFPEKYYLQPIPRAELERSNLQQNPGYN